MHVEVRGYKGRITHMQEYETSLEYIIVLDCQKAIIKLDKVKTEEITIIKEE